VEKSEKEKEGGEEEEGGKGELIKREREKERGLMVIWVFLSL